MWDLLIIGGNLWVGWLNPEFDKGDEDKHLEEALRFFDINFVSLKNRQFF